MYFDWRVAPHADFAVIGNPVGHSLSPRMHQAIYKELNLSYRYVAIQVDEQDVLESLSVLRRLGYKGVNVTVPHKQEALRWCTEVDPFAKLVQAVNTIDLKEHKGINTDAPGFLRTLEGFEFPDKTVLVLGAGGSARALVAALVGAGWKVRVYNRTAERAVELVSTCGGLAISTADPTGANLILNTTSAGFQGETPPVLWEKSDPRALAYDLMYGREPTAFLRAAQARGLRILDGLPLLVAQGALSFEYWTGLSAPVEAMTRALIGAA